MKFWWKYTPEEVMAVIVGRDPAYDEDGEGKVPDKVWGHTKQQLQSKFPMPGTIREEELNEWGHRMNWKEYWRKKKAAGWKPKSETDPKKTKAKKIKEDEDVTYDGPHDPREAICKLCLQVLKPGQAVSYDEETGDDVHKWCADKKLPQWWGNRSSMKSSMKEDSKKNVQLKIDQQRSERKAKGLCQDCGHANGAHRYGCPSSRPRPVGPGPVHEDSSYEICPVCNMPIGPGQTWKYSEDGVPVHTMPRQCLKLKKTTIKENDEMEPDTNKSNAVTPEAAANIDNFNQLGQQLRRANTLSELGQKLSECAGIAESLILREADDWFDSYTIKRNMKEIKNCADDFNKYAKEADTLHQRITALYDDLGHGLQRYFNIKDIEQPKEEAPAIPEAPKIREAAEPSTLRFIVKAGTKGWLVWDNKLNSVYRSRDTKSIAQSIADDANKNGPEGISGSQSRATDAFGGKTDPKIVNESPNSVCGNCKHPQNDHIYGPKMSDTGMVCMNMDNGDDCECSKFEESEMKEINEDAKKCPVCGGNGIDKDAYGFPGVNGSEEDWAEIACKKCNGAGIKKSSSKKVNEEDISPDVSRGRKLLQLLTGISRGKDSLKINRVEVTPQQAKMAVNFISRLRFDDVDKLMAKPLEDIMKVVNVGQKHLSKEQVNEDDKSDTLTCPKCSRAVDRRNGLITHTPWCPRPWYQPAQVKKEPINEDETSPEIAKGRKLLQVLTGISNSKNSLKLNGVMVTPVLAKEIVDFTKRLRFDDVDRIMSKPMAKIVQITKTAETLALIKGKNIKNESTNGSAVIKQDNGLCKTCRGSGNEWDDTCVRCGGSGLEPLDGVRRDRGDDIKKN